MWQQLDVQSPDAELLRNAMQRYGEPHHRYHTTQHLNECFAYFDADRSEAMHPAEIELELWFHDAIYDATRHKNEQQSADWLRSILMSAGGSTTVADRVHALVMVTCHKALPVALDEQILVDAYPSILAATPARFDQYETQVRAEYQWIPDETYRNKRAEMLQAFLNRKSIHNTAYFKANSEANARRNLVASIANLLTERSRALRCLWKALNGRP